MVLGAAVGDGPGPGGVGADHPAQAAVVLAGGVGREEGAVPGGLQIERGHHQPGLHPSPGAVGRHLEHAVHVAGEVDLDAGAYGSTGEAGAHAPPDQRDAVFRRILDQADDVPGVPGRDHAQGLHLVEAGVGRVEEA